MIVVFLYNKEASDHEALLILKPNQTPHFVTAAKNNVPLAHSSRNSQKARQISTTTLN